MTRPIRLLVVDDDPMIRDYVTAALPDEFEMETAADPDAAMAAVAERVWDVVLLDVHFDGHDEDGVEVCGRIRGAEDPPEVVMLTSDAATETVVEAMRRGAFDYQVKPIESVQHLEQVVRNAAERRRSGAENRALRTAVRRIQERPDMVAESAAMKDVLELVERAAPSDSTVLILGESGTGKELVAATIHNRSTRADRPFTAINCGALQGTLLESELFGHEKGAFTGAMDRRLGLIEVADRGTLFLDEIGEMPPDLQVKLLRFLQSGEIRRVGGNQVKEVDVRVVAATNQDLEEQVRDGRFRDDLFYRLNVIQVRMPPLRERREEIPLLATRFLERREGTGDDVPTRFSGDALEALRRWDWPGNVRELENLVERLSILVRGDEIGADDLPPMMTGGERRARAAEGEGLPSDLPLREVEARYVARVLESTRADNGGKWNKAQAARILEIDVKTLYNKIKTYDLQEPED